MARIFSTSSDTIWICSTLFSAGSTRPGLSNWGQIVFENDLEVKNNPTYYSKHQYSAEDNEVQAGNGRISEKHPKYTNWSRSARTNNRIRFSSTRADQFLFLIPPFFRFLFLSPSLHFDSAHEASARPDSLCPCAEPELAMLDSSIAREFFG